MVRVPTRGAEVGAADAARPSTTVSVPSSDRVAQDVDVTVLQRSPAAKVSVTGAKAASVPAVAVAPMR